MPLKPIFRWAGSKRKLLPAIMQCIPKFRRYVEPFAGSACLFFTLEPRRAVLGDLNSELIETYRSIRYHPGEVAQAVLAMPISEEFYYGLRSVSPEDLTGVARAARFVYLNRFCFNGVYRTNGRGEFNVPRGKRTGSLPTTIDFSAWSKMLGRAELFAGDFEQCVAEVREGDFIYLDPPYSKPNSRDRGEYGCNSFRVGDLDRLCACLEYIDSRGGVFVLSYRYGLDVREMFANWHMRSIVVRRHIAGFARHRVSVRELIVSNRQLGQDRRRAV
jgi:DNA adenine methylase